MLPPAPFPDHHNMQPQSYAPDFHSSSFVSARDLDDIAENPNSGRKTPSEPASDAFQSRSNVQSLRSCSFVSIQDYDNVAEELNNVSGCGKNTPKFITNAVQSPSYVQEFRSDDGGSRRKPPKSSSSTIITTTKSTLTSTPDDPKLRHELLLFRIAKSLPSRLLARSERGREEEHSLSDVLGYTRRNRALLERERAKSARLDACRDARFRNLITSLQPVLR